jgi:hypothetical protein
VVKLTVVYEPDNQNSHLCPDGLAKQYVEKEIELALENNQEHTLITSQENIIDLVRLFVANGKILPKDVEFRFQDNIIFPDKYGHLDWWPAGFCDYRDNLLTELLSDMFNTLNANKKVK